MIKQQVEDGILIGTFDNGKYNTINQESLKNLREIVDRANSDDSIKGVILTGEGKTFSSGFDLPMFMGFKDLDEVVTFFEKTEGLYIDLFMCAKPVVSAMNGATVAAGLITAMATDYRIMKNHPKIRLGMSEIKIGLGLSIVQTEIMRFGFDSDRKYRDVMFFGEMYDVSRAKELDLVDELVEEENLIPRAKEIVATWTSGPGNAFTLLKQSQRASCAERMRHRLENENWREAFNCFFDEETRGAIDMVIKMMG